VSPLLPFKMSSSLPIATTVGRLCVDALYEHAMNTCPEEMYNTGVLEQDARTGCRIALKPGMMGILRRWIYSTAGTKAEDIMADAETLAAYFTRGDFVCMDNRMKSYDAHAITLLMLRRHLGGPAPFEEAMRRLVVERDWLVSAFRKFGGNNFETMDRKNLPNLFVEDCEVAAKKAAELDAAAATAVAAAAAAAAKAPCCACACHKSG
jgi:hypothetical protein